MAGAKLKQGLDYFPNPTRIDSRVLLIRALHGFEGYVIYDYLFRDIHGEKGYYLKWSDKEAKVFALTNSFNYDTVKAVVKELLSEGVFDCGMYNSYQILTSKEIQEIWIHVAKERKEIVHIEEYPLIDIRPYLKSGRKSEQSGEVFKEEILPQTAANSEEKEGEINSAGINSINPRINDENLPDNGQSKVKHSIAKQSEAEESEVKEKKEKQTDFFKKEKSEANFFSLSANISPFEKTKEIFFQKDIDPPDKIEEKQVPKPENPEKEIFKKNEIPDVAPGNPNIKGSEKPKSTETVLAREEICEEETETGLNKHLRQQDNDLTDEREKPCNPGKPETGQPEKSPHTISQNRENSPFPENTGQTVIPEIFPDQEIQEKPPNRGKQENAENSDHSGNQEKQEKSDNTGKTEGKAKTGKDLIRSSSPHPVRPCIIKLWEDKFGQPYGNTFDGNKAIKGIIRHLEGLIRRAKKDVMISEEDLNSQIVELWQVILLKWDTLDKFYRSMIGFERIEKYFSEIINQLKVNGTERKSSPNGAKPSFDRFRKKYG